MDVGGLLLVLWLIVVVSLPFWLVWLLKRDLRDIRRPRRKKRRSSGAENDITWNALTIDGGWSGSSSDSGGGDSGGGGD
ncbi:hypothetical protein [Saccharopolyspora taberi]|uniref:Uncharacterized protein n=1 Tax=Saccharopolyspora taberi TaxID=60895 RepID=A0ABN3VB28_9PSEU